MNIVKSGNTITIYDSAVTTDKKLPVGMYKVRFNETSGFFLTEVEDLTAKENKIYGSINQKVNKTLKSFHLSNRNLGVLLSGEKGAGKTLFAQQLVLKGKKEGFPAIIIDEYFSGLSDFLLSITQEVILVFDEFEKTFQLRQDFDPQGEMLGVFDGLNNSKKLFLIICNSTIGLNQYILSRPGRFHYHFKMGAVTEDEIDEYLRDKLQPEYYGVISKVQDLIPICNLTYDDLRAIIFDINQGYSFRETINDLNIDVKANIETNVRVIYRNGEVFSCRNVDIELDMNREKYISLISENAALRKYGSISFDFIPNRLKVKNGRFTISLDDIHTYWNSDYYGQDADEVDMRYREMIDKNNIVQIEIIPEVYAAPNIKNMIKSV